MHMFLILGIAIRLRNHQYEFVKRKYSLYSVKFIKIG